MSGGVKNIPVREDEDGLRLDRWIRQRFPDMPFGRLQKAVRKGEVRIDGGRAKVDARLATGQVVRIPPYEGREDGGGKPDAARRAPNVKDAAFAQDLVIYKNPAILALNKPSGLAVQGGTKTPRHLDGMLEFLKFDAPERPRLVHRLDRDTSGVILLARDRQTAAKLGRALKNRKMRKVYWAITAGVPSPDRGTIDLPLAKAGGAGRERVEADYDDGKSAITDFAVVERAGNKTALVALWPRTGRTHQLRAHMAAIGTPILGDGKYGGKAAFIEGEDMSAKLHLHAREIVLPPGLPGAGATIRASLPDEFRQTCAIFEFDMETAAAIDPFDPFE